MSKYNLADIDNLLAHADERTRLLSKLYSVIKSSGIPGTTDLLEEVDSELAFIPGYQEGDEKLAKVTMLSEKCPKCGGPMVWDPGYGMYCGSWLYMEGGCFPAPAG